MNDSSALLSDRGLINRADWILMAVRGLVNVGFIVFNRLAPVLPANQRAIERLLLGFLAVLLLEAFFLWQGWGRRAWPQVTLALDLALVLVLLFLTGGVESPLFFALILPIGAISLRLGFTAGLGLNLASLTGYALLVVWDFSAYGRPLDATEIGLFGSVIILIGVCGGLISEQMRRWAKDEVRYYEERMSQLSTQYAAVNNRARAFYEMSSTLSVTMSYQKVLEGILHQCHRLLGFSVGVVLLTAGEEELYIAGSSGIRVDDTVGQISLRNGVLSHCLATAEPAILESLGRDEELRQILALQRCRSGLTVPLRAGLRNYGVIVLGSIHQNAYSQFDLDQLSALAHFATTAIQNAQLYQDLREERDKIISAEENVRKELSRDLHDGPAQALAAMAMNAEYIKRLLKEDPRTATRELEALEELARKTSREVRTMLFQLRPIMLATQGLVPTLEQYVERFSKSEGPTVHLETGSFDRRLDPKAETTVFTIMQEAVNNARKHAQAENIWLRLARKGDKLVASVQDDGVGFDLQKVEASYDERGSFGLLNMQERAELIGGHTEIRSAPREGTAVVITVPLNRT